MDIDAMDTQQHIRALLRNLVLPPTGPLLLALLGYILMRSRRFAKLGGMMVLTGLVVLWLLSTPVISGQLIRWTEKGYPPLDLSTPVAAEAVVILGGGTRLHAPEYGGGPAPTDVTLFRLAYGARVARATGLPVLVTGKVPEGTSMAEFLRQDFQIAPRWEEPKARNTAENASYSAAMLGQSGIKRIVLVTSADHMRRSVAEFEAHGLQVIPAPVGVHNPFEYRWAGWMPGLAGLEESHTALYELLGDVVRRMR